MPSAGSPAALGVLLLTAFVGIFDVFAVTVAAPTIEAQLPASFSEVQLTVAGYVVVYGAALMGGAWLGDLYGRRRMLVLGVGLLGVWSLACAAAPNGATLVTFRALQGGAAALAMPQVVALVQTQYQGAMRRKALGLYAATLGIAAVVGQVAGGALVAADPAGLGWRSVFLVVPVIAVVVCLSAPRLIGESRATADRRAPIGGSALLTLGLLGLLVAASGGADGGWPAWCVLMASASVALLVAFARTERRRWALGRPALLPRALMRTRSFTIGLIVVLTFYSTLDPLFLTLAYYLQAGADVVPSVSGLILAPLGLAMLGASLFANAQPPHYGHRLMQTGAVLMAVAVLGLVVLARLPMESGPATLIPVLVLHGTGQGLLAVPLIAGILARVPGAHAGAASGLVLTLVQVANALGVALLGTVIAVMLPPDRTIATAGEQVLDPFFRAAFGVMLALATVGALRLLARTQRAHDDAEP